MNILRKYLPHSRLGRTMLLLSAALLLILGGVLASFDVNRLTPLLTDWFLQNKHRVMHIGSLEWRWTGSPRLVIRDLRIAERDQPNQPFASIDRLEMDLALTPMLGRRLVSNQITLTGVTLRLQQQGDRWNVSDLLEPGSLIKDIDIRRLDLSSAQITLVTDATWQVDIRKLSAAPIRNNAPLQLTVEGRMQSAAQAMADWQVAATLNPGDAWHHVELSATALAAPIQGSRLQAKAELRLPVGGVQARAIHITADLPLDLAHQPSLNLDIQSPQLDCRDQACAGSAVVEFETQVQTARAQGRVDLQQVIAGAKAVESRYQTTGSVRRGEQAANLRGRGNLRWSPSRLQVVADELEMAVLPTAYPLGLNFSLPGELQLQSGKLSAQVNGRCLDQPCRFSLQHNPTGRPPWHLDGRLERLVLPDLPAAKTGPHPSPQDLLAPLQQLPLALNLQIGEWRQGNMVLRGLKLELAPHDSGN